MLIETVKHFCRHPYALLPSAPKGVINDAREWVNSINLKQPKDIRRGPIAWYWDIDPLILKVLPRP